MQLYIRTELLKSESSRGQQRGGKYVARIEVGQNDDGSPKYKYFETMEQYNAYLSKEKGSKKAKRLERKTKKEHKESTKKTRESQKKVESGKLFHKEEKKKPSVEKSLSHFIWRIDL